MQIFVYGTLLEGLERHSVLSNSEWLGPAMIEANLYDLGGFPGVCSGSCSVIGELYNIDTETLGQLDIIEGYRQEDEADSLFVRHVVQARRFSDGATVSASCYFFNDALQDNHIEHGDYRRYRLELECSEQWVLAYGSNMSIARLENRVGSIAAYKAGTVGRHDLVFNKKAWGKPTVYANLAACNNGACPAVAYQLSYEQVEILDSAEGTPNHYVRTTACFTDEDGIEQICQVYLAHPEQLVVAQDPEAYYLAHIQRGYEQHGFDDAVLENYLRSGNYGQY